MDIVRTKQRHWGAYAGALIAAIALGVVGIGVSRLERAAPTVAKNTVWIDTVKRGLFLREVSAPGSLRSDEVRLVTARATGIVDRVHVKQGATVQPDTLLIELTNPDLEYAALEAATAVKQAQAEVLDVQANLGIQRIEQRLELEKVRVEYGVAQRLVEANAPLAEKQIIAALDAKQQRENADELSHRLAFHEQHTQILEAGAAGRINAQRARVEGLRGQAQLRETQVKGLLVHAGAAGLLAELSVEVGQQVAIGSVLGKVINPSKLQAELRVPEARAKEIAVGNPVRVTVQSEEVTGRVTRVDPTVQQAVVKIEVTFDQPLPKGARIDLSVDGRIELERVEGALYTGKPPNAGSAATLGLFKLAPDGRSAERVQVRLGRTSVNAVEVLGGLREGDRVILSDTAEWDHVDRIEIE